MILEPARRPTGPWAAWADQIVVPGQRLGSESIRLHRDLTVEAILEALSAVRLLPEPSRQPAVDTQAVRGLKFSAALPEELAIQTISARIGDPDHALSVLDEQSMFSIVR